MKLALLGADDNTLALAKAAVDRTDCELAFVCELDDTRDARASELLRAVARSAQPLANWEDLLDMGRADWVIVARGAGDDRREDQLRKLVQAGAPVLVSLPVSLSMLIYYELDMIRQDTRSAVLAYLPHRLDPQLQAVRQAVSPSKVELITFERSLADRSKDAVLSHFTRDVDVLRMLCGELNQISALGTTDDDSAYRNLSVQLAGPIGAIVRWNVRPSEGRDHATITIAGSAGQQTIELGDDAPAAANRVLDQLGERAAPIEVDRSSKIDLLDAARSVELAETIPRSLARRRTIDLHYGDHTEENTFKGKMAATGCLLLMLGLGVLFVVAVLDQAKLPFMNYWPVLLAIIFVGFSLLQLLLLVARKKSDRGHAGETRSGR